jgi:hypothetical protein
MGNFQSRETVLERWLTSPKTLTALISNGGGLNSHLSVGLFKLAIAVSLFDLALFIVL